MIIHPVKNPGNLSHSRVTNFWACPARLGYDGLYEDFKRICVPYWLPGGTAIHKVIDEMVQETVVKNQPLPAREVDKKVVLAETRVRMALHSLWGPRGPGDKRITNIFFLQDEARNKMGETAYRKYTQGRIRRFLNQHLPGVHAVALRCTLPSPFRWTEAGTAVKGNLLFPSPRDPNVLIPIWGELDLLECNQRGELIITDWKTGSFSYFTHAALEGNEQMLYYYAIVRMLKKVDPTIAYFVSLNIPAGDVERYGAAVLEQDRYRAQAIIDFEKHFPDLLDQVSDVWDVLTFLSHPPLCDEDRRLQENWRPRSYPGKKAGLERCIAERRLLPNIDGRCAICPHRDTFCRTDNDRDWQEYYQRQRLGNVAEPPFLILPEDWIDPVPEPERKPEKEVIVVSGQMALWENQRPVRKSPLGAYKWSAEQWKAHGFSTPKEKLASLRRMQGLIISTTGRACPCSMTNRLNPVFDQYTGAFDTEREAHKCAQEAQGRTRSGKGGTGKVKELYSSEVVREALKDCPVPDCPFRKQDDSKTPQA